MANREFLTPKSANFCPPKIYPVINIEVGFLPGQEFEDRSGASAAAESRHSWRFAKRRPILLGWKHFYINANGSFEQSKILPPLLLFISRTNSDFILQKLLHPRVRGYNRQHAGCARSQKRGLCRMIVWYRWCAAKIITAPHAAGRGELALFVGTRR